MLVNNIVQGLYLFCRGRLNTSKLGAAHSTTRNGGTDSYNGTRAWLGREMNRSRDMSLCNSMHKGAIRQAKILNHNN